MKVYFWIKLNDLETLNGIVLDPFELYTNPPITISLKHRYGTIMVSLPINEYTRLSDNNTFKILIL